MNPSLHEKRISPRLPVQDMPRGALAVILNGHRITVERLRDISHSGLSFYLNGEIASNETISVAYADEKAKVRLEAVGRVAWVSKIEPTSAPAPIVANCLVGVELMSPMLLFAVMQGGNV